MPTAPAGCASPRFGRARAGAHSSGPASATKWWSIFEEGDPDQPLIVGSVYNAENMPLFELPANKKIAGIKSATVDSSPKQDYNAILFYDEKDKEHLSLHSERHLTMHAEYDKRFYTGRHTGEHVPGNRISRVGRPPGGGSDSSS